MRLVVPNGFSTMRFSHQTDDPTAVTSSLLTDSLNNDLTPLPFIMSFWIRTETNCDEGNDGKKRHSRLALQ